MKTRNLAIYVVIGSLIIALAMMMQSTVSSQNMTELTYSEMFAEAESKNIKEMTLTGAKVTGELNDGTNFYSAISPNDINFSPTMTELGVPLTVKSATGGFNFGHFLTLIFIGMIGFFIIMQYRQMNGGGGGRGAMNFGKSRARLLTEKQGRVTWALLVGPPGTGKTLIARAVAGEANVPFFTISGSDFVEMFVGVGASRVRDMFEKAKQNAPCIIFIDEIDAVGRSRGAGMGGGNDEREQTLNQLLVEMDGFETNEGIILIAATNRPDVLDPALLRPGRFDRQVTVGNPDVTGREKILLVHMRNVPTSSDVNPKVIARGTPGFSGADLANLVNEAALLAARRGKRAVAMREFEDAKDKVMMGPERRSMIMSEDEKALTAWHEAGHAIVALKTPASDPVHKATIIPRGRALGMVMQLPEDDKYSMSKVQMTSRLAILMGGRAAEEVHFGKDNVTAGASSDIQQATKLARAMVTQWGYSDKVGFVDYSEAPGSTFLGQQMGQSNVSEETSQVIESEVKQLVQTGMDTAMRILDECQDQWTAIAEGLLEYETLTGDEINTLINGGSIDRPDTDSGDNGPSSAVPVIGKRKPKGGMGGAGEPSPA